MNPHRLAFVLRIDPEVFALHAEENGWDQIEAAPDPDDHRLSQRWRVPGGELRFVDDSVIQVQYVDVLADPTGPVEQAIQAEFTGYDKSACLEIVDLEQAEQTVCHALRLLTATAAGDFDSRVFDVTIMAMNDEREEVRLAAITIVKYTGWKQFLEEIDRLASGDPSHRVRLFAENQKFILGLGAKLDDH